MYLFHKKMKEDAERAADIYWKQAYKKLAFEYQWVEVRLQNAHKEMEQMQAYIQRLEKQVDDLYTDYRARLKATGMNEADIQDFERYWQEHMKPSFHHDEMI
jgi:predicted  nucleic acid-binding Zn-ribbon protein